MKTYLYLSDIHSNFEALKHLDSLPEMQDPDCEIRFGGDYIDGVNLEPDAVINTLRYVKSLCDRLEELAKDNTAYIRTTIMTRYPESIKYVLAYQKHKRGLTYDEWTLIYETLRMSKIIDADAITDFLSYGIPVGLSYYQGRLDETIPAFKAQLKACRHSLDPIHKTMTSKQLYEAGSPHWVRGLSAQAIMRVQYAEHELQNDRKKVAHIFDALITDGTGCDFETMLDVVHWEKCRPD